MTVPDTSKDPFVERLNSYSEQNRRDFAALTFMSSYMFRTIMRRRPDLLKKMLCLLLGEKDLEFEGKPEHELQIDNGTHHGVRFDLRVRTTDERILLIEAQTYQEPQGAWELRSRFYSAMLDKDLLEPGSEYYDLPGSRLIWLCQVDPFGLGLPCYIFSSTCEQAPQLRGRDRALRLYFNARGHHNAADPALKAFLLYCHDGQPTDSLTKEIDMELHKIRQDPNELEHFNSWTMEKLWFGRQCRADGWTEGRDEGRIEGRAEGLAEGRAEGLAEGLAEGRAESQSEIERLTRELETYKARLEALSNQGS
ncbi:MAG: hypothetical protein IJ228_05805 [Succinivibrio sp.]|nr:hypothetical protein [Succinivibrio sp.]